MLSGESNFLRELEIAVLGREKLDVQERRDKLDIQFNQQWANDSNSCVYTRKVPQNP